MTTRTVISKSATRTVISKSAKRRAIPKGSAMYHFTEMVVYREKLPNGKFTSKTVHEIVRKVA